MCTRKRYKLSYSVSCWLVPLLEDETFGESLSSFFPVDICSLISSFISSIKGVLVLQIKQDICQSLNPFSKLTVVVRKVCAKTNKQTKKHIFIPKWQKRSFANNSQNYIMLVTFVYDVRLLHSGYTSKFDKLSCTQTVVGLFLLLRTRLSGTPVVLSAHSFSVLKVFCSFR